LARADWHLVWRLTLAGMRRRTADRVLGVAWWALDPLLLVAVYALVFGALLGLGRHEAQQAYPLFVACAIVPWRWFALASTQGAGAFAQNTTLLSSLPVPREAVLLAEWLAATIESLPGVLVLVAMAIAYGAPASWSLLWLPLPLAVLAALALGVAYLLCPLAVMLPDATNVYAALLRLLWFLSPGLYALAAVPESMRGAYVALNPLAGVLEGVRRPIHAGVAPDFVALACSAVVAALLLWIGRALFRRTADAAVRML
jgi:ABC-2 type transport system permease protein